MNELESQLDSVRCELQKAKENQVMFDASNSTGAKTERYILEQELQKEKDAHSELREKWDWL